MKFSYFNSKSVENQTRFLASHLPSGRVWNSKTGRGLWKLIYILANGSFIIYSMISEMIFDFRIESSTDFLENWEQSLGIVLVGTETIQERRDAVKAQYRKVTVVTKEEWESVLSTAFGRSIDVYPAKDIDMTDSRFQFPYAFPIYFYPVNPSERKQNRFTLYVDNLTPAEIVTAKKIVKKFRASNTRIIYIFSEE